MKGPASVRIVAQHAAVAVPRSKERKNFADGRVVTGMGAALGLTRLMAKELFGVSAHDRSTLAGVAVLLLVVALGASFLPARRAMRVDPIWALRSD